MRTSLRSAACLPSGNISQAETLNLDIAQPHHELLDVPVSSVDDLTSAIGD